MIPLAGDTRNESRGNQRHGILPLLGSMTGGGQKSPQELDWRGGGINLKEGRGGWISMTKRKLNGNGTEEGAGDKINGTKK